MLVDEALGHRGAQVAYSLVADGSAFALLEGDARIGVFSAAILCKVIERYARPLEPEMHAKGETLALGADGTILMAWYYKAPVDLEDKLYLVLHRASQESLAVLSRQVVSALRFLGAQSLH